MKITTIPPTEPEFELKLSRSELTALAVAIGNHSWASLGEIYDESSDFRNATRLTPSQQHALYDGMTGALGA